jgi:hypothetical protein
MTTHTHGDILDVPYSDFVVELKTGAWKKQLNQFEDGVFEVEAYWFNWIHESAVKGTYSKYFKALKEALTVYEKIHSLRDIQKLLDKDEVSWQG